MPSKLEDIIASLIALNRRNRETLGDRFRPGMPPRVYTTEFCTIIVDIGLGAGKTTAIANLAQPGDLIVVASFDEMVRYERMELIHGVKIAIAGRLISSPPETFKTIWVDEPRRVFQEIKPYELIARYTRTGYETFILVGAPFWDI